MRTQAACDRPGAGSRRAARRTARERGPLAQHGRYGQGDPDDRAGRPTTTAEAPQTGDAANPFGPDDWGTYGGTSDQIRHSPLTQITSRT